MKAFLIVVSLVLLTVSCSWAIKDDSLMLYLPFEEGTGEVVRDQSGNGIEGKLVNAKWSQDGKFGGCLLLESSDQYVEIPVVPELDITDQITIEFWIFPEQSQPDSNILGRRSQSNTGGYCVQWSAQFTGKPQIETWIFLGGWQGTRQKQQIAPELNQWHHIASVYDGKSLKQYVDGKLDVEMPASGKINSVQEVFRIGQAQTGLPGMIGKVDEVAIYNRALSEDEIKQDMMKGVISPVPPAGNLVTVWGEIKSP
jgi:hypothetical protein